MFSTLFYTNFLRMNTLFYTNFPRMNTLFYTNFHSLLADLGEVFRQSQLVKMVQNYVKVGRYGKTMR